jgi:radical SAM protein with 4Fe4S-binding SPASM domain
LDIYTYARKKGFLITILTNGTLITKTIADYLANLSPFCIDITLNGITEKVYEEVTQVKGSFAQVMQAIKLLKERNLPLTLKSNGMKINRDEILKIKQFSEELLGKNRFRCDLALCAGMDGSKKPCGLRLTPDEILDIQYSDEDMLSLCREQFIHAKEDLRLKQGYLFPCGLSSFHIDPYARMRLCSFIKEPYADIGKDCFLGSFTRLYAYFQGLKSVTDTKCRGCKIQYLCRQCPGRALAENGDMESPIEFYCALAHKQEEMRVEVLKRATIREMAK